MESITTIRYLSNDTHILKYGFSNSREQKLVDDDDFIIVCFMITGAGLAIALCGIFTNVINIKTFITMGIKDGVTTLFLSISCTDLAYVTLISMRNIFVILWTVELYTAKWLILTNPTAIVFFFDDCSSVMYNITVLTSVFLAVARCMCVAKPLHFKNMFTRSRCLMVLIFLYLFPIACQTAVFINMGIVSKFDKAKNKTRLDLWLSPDREQVKDVVKLMLQSILPLVVQVILVVCMIIMANKLRDSIKIRTSKSTTDKGAGATKLTGKDLQVVKQVMSILMIYIVLNTHGIIFSFMAIVEPRFDFGKLFHNMYTLMYHLKIVFESLNATVNIIVYYKYNPKFRSLCLSRKYTSNGDSSTQIRS